MNEIYLKFYETGLRKIHEDEFSNTPSLEFLNYTNDGYYELKKNVFIGKVDKKERFAFLLREETEDIFLNPNLAQDLLNDDIILVTHTKKFTRLELILKRGLESIVAVARKRKTGFRYFTEKPLGRNIIVEDESLVLPGSIVKLNVDKISDNRIFAKVDYIVGHESDPDIDIEIVLANYDWPHIDLNVLEEEARKINIDINEEAKKRLDLRDKLIVTIDGESAKDLDDAISLEYIDGNYHLGVHIADVSKYVERNSLIDKWAYKKATSAYLANKVVPMLPRKLSNDLCSLNPDEEKLTMSCNMVINKDGRVIDYEIRESIIKSSYRLTYTEVNNLIKNNVSLNDKELDQMILKLNELSLILKEMRKNRGELEFKSDELEFVFNEHNEVIDVLKRTQEDGEELIESMMLIANETVAFHMEINELPSIYRIHEKPDTERLENALTLLQKLNITFDRKGIANVKELQKILESVKGTKTEEIVNNTLLRSMQRAEYNNNPVGHFGLAARYYTHFTSPIRRYPDLLLHRLIKDFVLGENLSLSNIKYYEKNISDFAKHSSKMERIAIDMEREVVKLKSCEYLLDKIYNKFDAQITSIIKTGMFVKTLKGIEGFVRFENIDFNDKNNEVVVSKKIDGILYTLGDNIKVELINVDMQRLQIDFEIVSEERSNENNS